MHNHSESNQRGLRIVLAIYLICGTTYLAMRFAVESSESGGKLWIPDGLDAMRWDKTTFLVEAILSRFEIEGRGYYTLILRNIDERLAARRRIEQLSLETEYMKSALDQAIGGDSMIGECPAMRTLFDGIERVAQTDATALVLGETGTGKELVARSLHRQNLRRNRPLVCVNCGAIPGSLMESEFFGHEKGAFIGASEHRKG
jgi:transcriptional regulator with GAF, ATPase, and Fis domain